MVPIDTRLAVEQVRSRHRNAVIDRVADDLGVHRNTVRHRIGQIEQALQRSLTDPQVRVDASVALQSRRTIL